MVEYSFGNKGCAKQKGLYLSAHAIRMLLLLKKIYGGSESSFASEAIVEYALSKLMKFKDANVDILNEIGERDGDLAAHRKALEVN